MPYLAAAEHTGEWLIGAAERRPDGCCWPWRPGLTTYFALGVGWGTAGPVMFFAEAFAATGDQRWLDAARHRARWMDAKLNDVAAEWAGAASDQGRRHAATVPCRASRASRGSRASREPLPPPSA